MHYVTPKQPDPTRDRTVEKYRYRYWLWGSAIGLVATFLLIGVYIWSGSDHRVGSTAWLIGAPSALAFLFSGLGYADWRDER